MSLALLRADVACGSTHRSNLPQPLHMPRLMHLWLLAGDRCPSTAISPTAASPAIAAFRRMPLKNSRRAISRFKSLTWFFT